MIRTLFQLSRGRYSPSQACGDEELSPAPSNKGPVLRGAVLPRLSGSGLARLRINGLNLISSKISRPTLPICVAATASLRRRADSPAHANGHKMTLRAKPGEKTDDRIKHATLYPFPENSFCDPDFDHGDFGPVASPSPLRRSRPDDGLTKTGNRHQAPVFRRHASPRQGDGGEGGHALDLRHRLRSRQQPRPWRTPL